MKKIDLIIDALENAVHNFAGDDTEEKLIAALAAARELKALKPLAYYDKRYDTVMTAYELGRHVDDYDVALYALDEVKHD